MGQRKIKRVKVLNSDYFPKQIEELRNTDFKVASLRGFISLEQTKRNRVSRDLMEGLYKFLKRELEDKLQVANVYDTVDGIALEVANDNVYEQFKDGNGCITLLVNIAIPNLEYDALNNLRDEDENAESE